MTMTSRKFDKIGETLYTDVLPNGLRICVNSRPGFEASYAAFATNYGGADRRFRSGGEWTDTPAGVAHFLEHKMFDMPDGDNALDVLSANGADPNAFTSAGMTCYYFESTRDFYENLRLLLRFVSTPYFTPESVEKEQGIIGQEIGMTEDSPDFAVYIGLMKLLYKNHPIRDAVAGTVESISEINTDTLYSCHKVFYNPSNMTLCCAGDIDPDKVRAIAEEVLPRQPGNVPETDFGPKEPEAPDSRYAEIPMAVSAPQFLIGARVTPEADGEKFLRQKLVGSLALRILCGPSSPFYTGLYAQGLLNRDFDYELDWSAGTGTVMIGGESTEPKEVLERLSKAVESVSGGISPEAFDMARRASLGARLRGLEDFDNVCVSLAEGVFGGYCAFDAFEVLESISPDECADFIARHMAPDKLAMSVILPDKEQTDD